MEIRCPKSILNVAERAKKGKNRYISGFRARSGRRGRVFKSRHPDQQNLSNQSVSEVFALFKILQKIDFDHNFLSSTVGQSPFLCLVLYKHSPKLLYCSLASYAYFCYNEKVMD